MKDKNQIYFDIAGANNFQDLQRIASLRLSAIQAEMYSKEGSKSPLDKLNSLTNEK